MARLNLIKEKGDLTPEHHALFDELATLRGRVSGPSAVVLHSPGLAGPWNEPGEYLHLHSVVEAKHAELAVCVSAREHDCSYIWAAHVGLARTAGVSEQTLAAVRGGGSLEGLPAEEATVVRYVQQLMRTNRVEGDVFDALLSAHDPRWMVELTAWAGRYAALAGILNAFEVSPAPDAESLPPAATSMPARREARAPLPAPRVRPITQREQVAEADRGVFDAVAEGRGSVRGPFSILMYSPELCQSILSVSNYLRRDDVLAGQRAPRPPRLRPGAGDARQPRRTGGGRPHDDRP